MSFEQNKHYLPDVIGLLALLVMVFAMSIFVPSSKVSGVLWIAIYLGWAATALFVWYKMDAYRNKWLSIVGLSVGGAALWCAATRAISYLSFGAGEPALSKVFDLVIVLMMSPGLTFIALAGWVRELIKIKRRECQK